MAFVVGTGSFNLTTSAAGSTQVVTHALGVTAKLILLFNAGGAFTGTTDSTTGTSLNYSVGAAISASSEFAITYRSNDNATSWTGAHGQRGDSIIYAHNHGGIISGQFHVSAIDDQTFTLEVSVASGAIRTHWLAIGGTDVDCAIVQGAEPGATGTTDITSSGFGTPTGALFLSVADGTVPLAGNANNGFLMVGAYDGTSNAVVAVASDSGSDPSDTGRYGTDAHCIALPTAPPGVDALAAGDSFITDGVRVNFTARAATRVVWTILLKGIAFKVFNSVTKTDGADIAVTGAGGTPKGGLVFSHCTAESASGTADAHASVSIGVWDSATSRRAAALWDEDGTNNSEVGAGIEHDAVYLRISSADAVEGLMDVKSVDADGVTFVMDDTDPDAAWFGGVILSELAGGTTGTGSMAVAQPVYGATSQLGYSGTGSMAVTVPVMSGTGAAGFSGTGTLAVAIATLAGTGLAGVIGSGSMAVAQPIYAFGDNIAVSIPAMSGTGKLGYSGTGTLAVEPAMAGDSAFAGTGLMAVGQPSYDFTAQLGFSGTGTVAVEIPALSGLGLSEDDSDVGTVSPGGGAPSRVRRGRSLPYEWEGERQKVEEVFEQHVEPALPTVGKPRRVEPIEADVYPAMPTAPAVPPELAAADMLLGVEPSDDDDEDTLLMLLASL